MNNYDYDSLVVQLETVQKTLKQREEDCENSANRIAELELELQNVNSDPSSCQELQIKQVEILQNNLKNLLDQHKELQERYFNLMAKKNYYKKNYKILEEKQKEVPPRTLSEAESNNKQLKEEIIELKNEIESYKEKSKIEKQESDYLKKQYDSNMKSLEDFKKSAQEHYELIKKKMEEAREGKPDPEEISQLKKDNETLQTMIDTLNEASQQLTSGQSDFINNLSSQLGCQPELDEIVDQVKKLVPLKVENLKLNAEIEQLKVLGTVDQNEAYVAVIDGLKEMQSKLSPDELKLDVSSPLKHLFASIYNMINALISPSVSKASLQSHVRAVYYQARAFKKKDLEETANNLDGNKQTNENSINLSPKATAIDVEIGNTFSSISSNSRINNIPSSIEFPQAKSSE